MTSIQFLPPSELRPWQNCARVHPQEQLTLLAKSIQRFGFVQPVLVDEDNQILAGHARVRAARQLGFVEIPCITVDRLSEIEKRSYILADNKLALHAEWDKGTLSGFLLSIFAENVSFDIGLTGFSGAEIDQLITTYCTERNLKTRERRNMAAAAQRSQ